MLEKSVNAQLILENGMIFEGKAFGHIKESIAEVVFTTSMVGYQETISDPTYAGKIIVMTYPLIGNAGINLEDIESDTPRIKGLIVREKCSYPNNWRCEMELEGFLVQHKIMGIEGIDTRQIMTVIQAEGTMKAIITTSTNLSGLEVSKKFKEENTHDIVKEITCKEKYTIKPLINSLIKKRKLAIIDLGVKNSVIKAFKDRGYEITLYPANTKAEEILADNNDAVLISNGAGCVSKLDYVSNTIKELIGKVAIIGFGIGHCVIAKALGLEVVKMKSGHYGSNYPIKYMANNKVYITSQAIQYVVKEVTDDIEVTFTYVNDKSIKGIYQKEKRIYSTAFCPDSEIMINNTSFIFDEIQKIIDEVKINA